MEQIDKNAYVEYLKNLKEKAIASQQNEKQAQIQDYNQYRVGIMYLIANDDPNNYICSQLQFLPDNVCHTLSIMTSETREIVLQKKFPYDDNFKNYFFIPSVMDFAQANRVIRTNVEEAENNMVNYQCITDNDNIMLVSGIDRELAELLDDNIRNIDYDEFERKRKEEEYKKKANGNPYVLKISHIISVFIFLLLTLSVLTQID